MNVLLINHYAGSMRHGMEYRPYHFACEWLKQGHKVTVLAASHSHVRQTQPKLSPGPITEEIIDGIRYLWIRTPAYAGNGAGRILNMLAFVFAIWRLQKQILARSEPNLVIASSTYPLDMIPAARLARRAQAKLLFEVHDLWPLSPMELGGMSKWHPAIVMMQMAENYAYRRADRVISMLPLASEHMISHGMDPSKFEYILNGVDPADWATGKDEQLPEVHRAHLAKWKSTGRFVVCYAGAHGTANALDTLIDAGAKLKGSDIEIVLVGHGPEKARLEAKVKALGLTNVTFLPSIPKNLIPKLFEEMDAMYIGLQRQSLFRFGVSPNKLLDYMMAGKPIVYAIEAGNDPVKEAGCGVSIPAENPDSLSEALMTMRNTPPAQLADMGRRGREFVTGNHLYSDLAARMISAAQPQTGSV